MLVESTYLVTIAQNPSITHANGKSYEIVRLQFDEFKIQKV